MRNDVLISESPHCDQIDLIYKLLHRELCCLAFIGLLSPARIISLLAIGIVDYFKLAPVKSSLIHSEIFTLIFSQC